MLRRLAALASTLLVVLPSTALAVWGGDEDLAHPSVGAMYFDFAGDGIDAQDLICSGSYAGESTPQPAVYDVFLTAGHCLPAAEDEIDPETIFVSFDPDGRDGVTNLIQVSAYYQMPGFGHDAGDYHDLGILLLPRDSVSAGIPAVQLPTAGYLDGLKAAPPAELRSDEHGPGATKGVLDVGGDPRVGSAPRRIRTPVTFVVDIARPGFRHGSSTRLDVTGRLDAARRRPAARPCRAGRRAAWPGTLRRPLLAATPHR